MVLVTCPASCAALMGGCKQGRNEVRWRPGQEASLAPPCSNLRSFGSKSTVLKKVLATLLGIFGPPTAVSRRPGNYASLPARGCKGTAHAGAAIDTPPAQHPLRKWPRGQRRKQAETGAHARSRALIRVPLS